MIPTEWYVKSANIKRENWEGLASGESDFIVANDLEYSCVCRCICDGETLGYMALGQRIVIRANTKQAVIETLRHLLVDTPDFSSKILRYVVRTDDCYQATVFHVRHVTVTFEQLADVDDGEEEW